MKTIYRRLFLIVAIVALPTVILAQAPISSSDLIRQMQTLLDQYNQRIQFLEAENNLLKNTLAKHQISIPTDEYNKAMSVVNNNSAKQPLTNTSSSSSQISTPDSLQKAQNLAITTPVTSLQKGFINQINKDWKGIKWAYSFPENAWIGGYEFVKNDAGNNVFVGIVFGDGTPEGAYHAKLLYEFDKKTFNRKLIGLFMYNTTTKMYSTQRGTNPFSSVARDKVHGTYITVNTPTTSSGASNSSNQNQTHPPVTSNNPQVSSQSSADAKSFESKITSIYQARDYNQVLKLSEEFLQKHAPTQRIYQLRYRSYFVLRDFDKALVEVTKMEQAKLATPFAYCEAYAIAMHAGRQDLVKKYKELAGPGCSTTWS